MASLYLMAVFIEPRLAILAELYVAILAGPEHNGRIDIQIKPSKTNYSQLDKCQGRYYTMRNYK